MLLRWLALPCWLRFAALSHPHFNPLQCTPRLFQIEAADGFDVGGLGEHVDDAGIAELVAFTNEYGGIAGEGGGVAGDVHDAAGEAGGVQGLDEGVGAAAGRVEQNFVEIAPAGDGVFGGLEEVGTVELGAFGEVVEAGILAGALGEFG